MRSLLVFSFLAFCFVGYGQIINFPDANFKNALVNGKCVDTDGNGNIDGDADLNNDGEIDVSEALKVINLLVINSQISNLSGIEQFKNLKFLNCYNNQLTSLNMQGLKNLESLVCFSNQLTDLNVQGLTKLKGLNCSNNQLTSLNVQDLTNLTSLDCSNNQLSSLNIEGLINFILLNCGENQLTSLDVQGFTNLTSLDCEFNRLTSLNLQGLAKLESLVCYSNQLTSLNVQGLTKLTSLDCYINNLTNLNLQGLTNLKRLSCSSNKLTFLNVQGLTNLTFLQCYTNQLTNLNVQGLINLEYLSCGSNQLTLLDLQGLINLELLSCASNQLTSLNVQGLTNLIQLYCSKNQLISLNVQGLTNLKTLFCNDSQIKSLNVQGLINLKTLYCFDNQMTSLNLTGLTNLEDLYCYKNQLNSLNLNGLINLENLNCNTNQLTSLDVQGLINLERLTCFSNKLSSLNIQGLVNLKNLDCHNNHLASLDVQGLMNLELLSCGSNQLTSLNIKNTKIFNDNEILFENNPNLKYICCNEERIEGIKDLTISNGQSCEVNSYCTFTPDGKFYLLKGENIYDGNENGCDDLDTKLQFTKFNITNGSLTGSFISNSTGRYSIPLQDGTHTVTPILENPHAFTITPSSYTITFPSTFDTITQNFCITPKGIFRQTNITVIPLSPPARPGFDAKYKIVWENAGNQIEIGTLNFTYDETLLDFISATQAADQITDGIIKWNFTNLLPFEKREITVTLKVNRPTDTPAVNAGDKLYLTASILDNIFTLENTVVGSYDPNDKTCLQGDSVKPDMVGEYVDYLIRYENTGNYAAENVVVKDIIDTKRFDVSTLQITDASHEVYTRIEGNKVEFIFENIKLPFDDANNDGYIAFKIKTLPSVVLGDSLKNLADIYFDYNFPIRTNEAKTTIALSVPTVDIITDFSIYPNPVRDILNISTEEKWTKAEIYDISGRIMRIVSLDSQSIDVSGLETGTYFIRLKDGDKVGLFKFFKI